MSITFNGKTKVLTAGTANTATTFVADASAATTAANIKAALDLASNPFGAGYTFTNSGIVVTITKTTGAPTETLSVSVSK